ncbi:hypothetical protein KY319_02735 [Candidatus Woesearchaeota archaeon]|nr:hypothetical protein [Candidatus Woesearchaeota archaeon]
MSVIDKLKFWKKEEEAPPEYPKTPEFTPPPETPPAGMEHLGMPRPTPGLEPPAEPGFEPSFAPPKAFAQQASMSSEQQLQLINSKLDTIKAQLETVLQRLERLEKKDELSPYQQRWRNI